MVPRSAPDAYSVFEPPDRSRDVPLGPSQPTDAPANGRAPSQGKFNVLPLAAAGTKIEVDVLEGRRVATVLNGDPAFDPKNERLRA